MSTAAAIMADGLLQNEYTFHFSEINCQSCGTELDSVKPKERFIQQVLGENVKCSKMDLILGIRDLV